MTDKFPVSLAVPAGQGLAGYIQAVNAAPLLSAEQELSLARRYREQEDLDAARELRMNPEMKGSAIFLGLKYCFTPRLFDFATGETLQLAQAKGNEDQEKRLDSEGD